ncbi:MAG: phosphonate metabolism protein/1,5-bisphosphokinase (PRPP-forming) PhnN [Micrococcales bacterium]|nr:phosphonate metabolism protein/1,5-bisphosphokinase (PRPP-forming) PhnN [Micrococcales bacterium]MCL2667919.1 phosphonate metabolism protein/1,5-bisphosphokinase (PRPP-forming) PhnN [Micrococcales bacterium]
MSPAAAGPAADRKVGPGAFVAVVGASGVGKDSLIAYAAGRLGPLVMVPRRVITRPAGPGEDHLPVTKDEFANALAEGAFACHWDAHGLRYGLPACVDDVVRDGRVVVANVSRTVLDDLAGRYDDLRVVLVTAAERVRAHRLSRRGRETRDEVTRRLDRDDPAPGHKADLTIINNGSLAEAGDVLTTFLEPTGEMSRTIRAEVDATA